MAVTEMKEAISKYNIMGIEYVKLEDLNALISVMMRKIHEHTEPGYLIEDNEQRIAAKCALVHLKAVLNKEKNMDGMLMRLYKTRIEREAAEADKPVEVPTEEPTCKAADRLVDDENDTTIKALEDMVSKTAQAINGAVESLRKVLADIKADGQNPDSGERRRVAANGGKAAKSDKEWEKKNVPARYTIWRIFFDADGNACRDICFVRWEHGIPVFSKDPAMMMWFVHKDVAHHMAEKLGEGFRVVDMYSKLTKEERIMRAIFLDEDDPCKGEPADDDGEDYQGDGIAAEDEDWDGEEDADDEDDA